jgi:hypothetical protein
MNTLNIEQGASLRSGTICKRGLTEAELRCLHTPWGKADYGVELLPGVMQVSTPSHGGFYLSLQRRAALPLLIQEVPTFCGEPCWFEEDCDWALVAIGYPALFTDRQLYAAVLTVQHTSYHKAAALWLGRKEAEPVLTRAALGNPDRTVLSL